MGVRIKPNNKCCACLHYVDERCARGSVPRFCGARFTPREPEAPTSPPPPRRPPPP